MEGQIGEIAGSQPLDEMMLAMDVVDTLRYRMQLVEHELGGEIRDEELKEKLRKIYAAQGITVPDQVLAEGVRALREDRFSYHPPAASVQVLLAKLYVSRGRWSKWLAGACALLAFVFALYYFLVQAPASALPKRLDAVHTSVKKTARIDEAKARGLADDLYASARVALEKKDTERAQDLLTAMENLRDTLKAAYRLEIVVKPQKRSGIWRVPDVNTGARNYYILVEAVGPDGKPVMVPVTSEETGATEVVSTWGLRVDEATFNRIARDKQDDGIIQNRLFGVKESGTLEPVYRMPTSGGAITQW